MFPLLLYSFAYLLLEAASLRILVFNPTTSESSVTFIGALADTLADAGHTVDVIAVEVDRGVRHPGARNANKLIVVPSSGNPINNMEARRNPFRRIDMLDGHFIANQTIISVHACKDLITGTDVWGELKSREGYDVGIAEHFCAFSIMRVLRVRATILVSPSTLPLAMSRLFGLPAPPSYVADPLFDMLAGTAPELPYGLRAFSVFATAATSQLLEKQTAEESALVSARWPSLTPMMDLVRNASFILTASHPLLELPCPGSHKIVHLGGLTTDPAQWPDPRDVVDPDLMRLLESAKGPVVVIDLSLFGRSAEIEKEVFGKLTSAIKRFPEATFLWRLEGSEGQKLPRNVHLIAEMKPRLILSHPAVKGFITDMSAAALIEGNIFKITFSRAFPFKIFSRAFSGVAAGVPLLAIPLIGDQPYHAAIAVKKDIALLLAPRDCSSPKHVVAAIEDLLGNSSRSEAAAKLSRALRLWPIRPRETLVRYVEFAAEFGRIPLLDQPQLSFFYYYSLDVIVPIAVFMILASITVMKRVVSLLSFILGRIFRRIFGRRRHGSVQVVYEDVDTEEESEMNPVYSSPHEAHGHGHSHGGGDPSVGCSCWRHEEEETQNLRLRRAPTTGKQTAPVDNTGS